MKEHELKVLNMELALNQATNVFLANGIGRTTSDMISKATGLPINVIEHFFPDKTYCVFQVAKWIAHHVWDYINNKYPDEIFVDGKHTGSRLLEMYLTDLMDIFFKDSRIFVFYNEFNIYLSENSENYEKEYKELIDMLGCCNIIKKIFEFGIKDGSFPYIANAEDEAEYMYRAYFGLLSNMAVAYVYEPEKVEMQLRRYRKRVLFVYENEVDKPEENATENVGGEE
jgi:AcrR family transcriptional regulator